MSKFTYCYIDDVIWLFRDLTRQKPKSIYDNPFLAVLKKAHDLYGFKVQLNLFYRTDFFYGNDEFTLTDMTDAYKDEFTAASEWLKFGFHAKQEFPDYPYINASYEDVKNNFETIRNEIYRFAGPDSFAKAALIHWLPMSKEGCRALYDCGIRLMGASTGEKVTYNGDPFSLPYGHAGRLLHNRKPESALFTRISPDLAIETSLCGYNHISDDINDSICFTLGVHKDSETGMYFKDFCNGPCLNLVTLAELSDCFAPLLGREYVSYATHEQYFYEDYYAYQSEYPAKILASAKLMAENGYEHIFLQDIV